jgi:signal transduction histidine kinase
MKASPQAALRKIADQVLEAADLEGLSGVLTRRLPAVLGVSEATLLLWDRKLGTFEGLSPDETQPRPMQPGGAEVQAPLARYLIVDGTVVETPGRAGEGALLPLLARSGLAGMLVLGRRGRRRVTPYRAAEARLLCVIASRAALALENNLYLKELIATERVAALGTMAGMLAHDFRGPMTVIRGYAETLLEPNLPPEEIVARAQLIMQSVDRLERMTSETLDFARGGGRLALRRVPLVVFLHDLAAAVMAEVPGLEIVPAFAVPPGIVAALDVDKLGRVMVNIAANAHEAMSGAGRLHLQATIADAALELIVADDGPGVPEEVRDRIFEPFVTHGKKKGTGLGLAVARRFVEDHGGAIELLREAPPPATGAAFRITLPL